MIPHFLIHVIVKNTGILSFEINKTPYWQHTLPLIAYSWHRPIVWTPTDHGLTWITVLLFCPWGLNYPCLCQSGVAWGFLWLIHGEKVGKTGQETAIWCSTERGPEFGQKESEMACYLKDYIFLRLNTAKNPNEKYSLWIQLGVIWIE